MLCFSYATLSVKLHCLHSNSCYRRSRADRLTRAAPRPRMAPRKWDFCVGASFRSYGAGFFYDANTKCLRRSCVVKDRVGRLGFIEPMLPVAVTSLTTADAPLPNTKLAARDAKMRII